MRYNILILHGQGLYRPPRMSMINHLRFLERYAPGNHNILYHRWDAPVTDAIRRTQFHVIIWSTCALRLCRHRPRTYYYEIRDTWSFVADLDAIKLAFPQDDYHQTTELDALFSGLKMTVIYCVLPRHMHMLYPLSRRCAKLTSVLTGYIDDDAVRLMEPYRQQFEKRKYDAFHRVTQYPYFGGSFSQKKGSMAIAFEMSMEKAGLKTNISTKQEDVLNDNRWYQALGDSRFSLGCDSGVSLWDPDGVYVDRVRAYMRSNPNASFRETEAACFPGEDGTYVFSAASPRLLESAMMGCSLILTEGEHLGLLQPWEHYIPVREDLRNVEDAVKAMSDLDEAKRRVALSYEVLVENPALRYSALAKRVMRDIGDFSKSRQFRVTDPNIFERMGNRPSM